MPQLDPSSYSSQLFWLTVSFVLLYVMLGRMLLPRVQSVLALRQNTLAADIEQARRMKADADLAREHYEKALHQARSNAQALLAQTQAEIVSRAATRQTELDAVIAQKLAESDTAIAAATAQAMGKIASVASELTSRITQAVAEYTPDSGAVDKAVAVQMKKGA